MFDELAERSLMSPLAGTKHTYVRLAIIIYCQILALFFKFVNGILRKMPRAEAPRAQFRPGAHQGLLFRQISVPCLLTESSAAASNGSFTMVFDF